MYARNTRLFSIDSSIVSVDTAVVVGLVVGLAGDAAHHAGHKVHQEVLLGVGGLNHLNTRKG